MSVTRRVARALVAASLVATLVPAGSTLAQGVAFRAAPVVNPDAAPWRGVFRVQLQHGTTVAVPATIIVERLGGQLSATMLVDERVSPLQSPRFTGDVLEAVVSTESGPAKLSLRVSGDTMDGTLTAKKRAWTVRGERSA
jgi:hypothetical protein